MTHKAFTMLETLLVLTIFSIAVGMAVLFGQMSQVRADLNAQAQTLTANMRLMQSNAAFGKGDSSHGVHLETDSYTLFTGSTYTASDTSNVVVSMPASVEIQNISLNGGGTDIIFSAPDGSTDQYGTIDLVSTPNGDSRQITISALGSISY